MAEIKLGVIGYGGRISGIIRGFKQYDGSVRVTAVIDPNEEFIREERLCDEDKDHVTFYKKVETMMRKEKLDAILVGTRCNLHAKYAVHLAKYDVAIFLEKPVSVTMKQATDLERAYEKSKARVLVSFPLRVSPLAEKS
jgi:predicted dehydrogenase